MEARVFASCRPSPQEVVERGDAAAGRERVSTPSGTKLGLAGLVTRTRRVSNTEDAMLYTIAVILLVLWLLGFVAHIGGGLIHLLLVIAVIVIVYRLITGRRVV